MFNDFSNPYQQLFTGGNPNFDGRNFQLGGGGVNNPGFGGGVNSPLPIFPQRNLASIMQQLMSRFRPAAQPGGQQVGVPQQPLWGGGGAMVGGTYMPGPAGYQAPGFKTGGQTANPNLGSFNPNLGSFNPNLLNYLNR